MPRVLIVAEAIRNKSGPHTELLSRSGFEFDYPEKRVLTTEDETIAAMRGCVAAIAGGEPYTDRVLNCLPDFRVISRNGVGYDRVDVAAATRHGVAVTITPHSNHEAVAEHAMALLLAVARGVVRYAVETRGGIWHRSRLHMPLRGRTLGIVGLGRIGRSVARRAAAFGMRLVACDMYHDAAFIQQHAIELVGLDDLLARADYVTLHTPMGPETRELINERTLARMKRGAVLINTARGGLVNEGALAEALRTGHLAGAGLDVLQQEPPPPDHPLLAMDNVVISPHSGSFDTTAVAAMALAAAQNIVDLLGGRWPADSVVNPEVQSAWIR